MKPKLLSDQNIYRVIVYQCSLFLSVLFKRVLYCEVVILWRYEVVNKHHTEGKGKAIPSVGRYK